jgi:hypothetical protein
MMQHQAWGVRIAAKRGHKRAVVAVARKLAVVMHVARRQRVPFCGQIDWVPVH